MVVKTTVVIVGCSAAYSILVVPRLSVILGFLLGVAPFAFKVSRLSEARLIIPASIS